MTRKLGSPGVPECGRYGRAQYRRGNTPAFAVHVPTISLHNTPSVLTPKHCCKKTTTTKIPKTNKVPYLPLVPALFCQVTSCVFSSLCLSPSFLLQPSTPSLPLCPSPSPAPLLPSLSLSCLALFPLKVTVPHSS